MASGGILLRSDGARILDSTGNEILDDSCVRCCCPAGQRYKVVVAGVATNTCPIPNWLGACAGASGTCDILFNTISTCGGPFPPADQMCGLNIAGNVNGTYYLSGPGHALPVSQCGYFYAPNPPPITVSLNKTNPATARYICADPDHNIAVNFLVQILFSGLGDGRRISFFIDATVAVPGVGNVVVNMFQNLQNPVACGQYCNADDVIANQNVLSWSTSPPVVYSGIGGTATITEI